MIDTEIEIPRDQESGLEGIKLEGIKIRIKADHMSIHIEKGETGV